MTWVMLAVLLWQVIDFLRELANLPAEKSAVLTQLCAWAGGIVVVVLAAHANVAAGVVPDGLTQTLSQLDFASQVLVGLMAASLGSSAADLVHSIGGASGNPPKLLKP